MIELGFSRRRNGYVGQDGVTRMAGMGDGSVPVCDGKYDG